MAKTSPEELKLMRDKIMLATQYLVEKLGAPEEALLESKKLAEEAYQKGKARILRSGSTEVDTWIREWPLQNAIELKGILKERLDINYDAVDRLRIKEISKIIKRGSIKTEDEYRLIHERADEIYADEDKRNEMETLNGLLVKFDERMSKARS